MTEIEEQLTMENNALRNEVERLRAQLDKIKAGKHASIVAHGSKYSVMTCSNCGAILNAFRSEVEP